jgi:hypothetical protein
MGTWSEHRAWQVGDTVTLEVDLTPRVTPSDPRVDATRGCVALSRGPLVYCIETADIPDGVELEDVAVAPTVQPIAIRRDDLGPSFVGLSLPATVRPHGRAGGAPRDVEVGAIPYFAWANRSVKAMRVWIPTIGAPGQREGGAVD